jgi:hypothetical protein
MRAGAVLPLILPLILAASACSTVHNTVETVKSDANPESPVRDTQTTGQKVGVAVASPLHDVNLVRTKIPAILLQASDGAYERPKPLNCMTLKAVITPLDEVLGPDFDQPPKPKMSKTKQGEAAAGDASIDAIKGTEEGFIPFVGWVRLLSGAERYDKQVQRAILAGEVRRAYLKGLGLRLRCEPPAAPLAAALEVPFKPTQSGPATNAANAGDR